MGIKWGREKFTGRTSRIFDFASQKTGYLPNFRKNGREAVKPWKMKVKHS